MSLVSVKWQKGSRAVNFSASNAFRHSTLHSYFSVCSLQLQAHPFFDGFDSAQVFRQVFFVRAPQNCGIQNGNNKKLLKSNCRGIRRGCNGKITSYVQHHSRQRSRGDLGLKPQAILEIADTLLCLPFTTACLEESTQIFIIVQKWLLLATIFPDKIKKHSEVFFLQENLA